MKRIIYILYIYLRELPFIISIVNNYLKRVLNPSVIVDVIFIIT